MFHDPDVTTREWLWHRRNGMRMFVLGHALRLRRRTFTFDGQDYRYFSHPYNEAYAGERAVEVAIALRRLSERRGGRILELGNVLSHYGRRVTTVVDKYEEAPGVLNVDVMDFEPAERFDLVVSLSTVEHIGFDEDVKDPGKPRRAVERLTSLLAPGGDLLVTVPLGYNPAVDELSAPGSGAFERVGYLRRVSADNRWEQVAWEDVRDAAYGRPYRVANAIAVGTSGR